MEPIIKNPINLTDAALSEVRRLMTEPNFEKGKVLRVGVKGGGCSGMTYVLDFDTRKDNDAL